MGRGPLTLREYLAIYEEAVPDWLARFDLQNPMRPADRLQDFLRSRTVYYPGSYIDGGPVAAFNSAHAAHCFIYVDYHLEPDSNRWRKEANALKHLTFPIEVASEGRLGKPATGASFPSFRSHSGSAS